MPSIVVVSHSRLAGPFLERPCPLGLHLPWHLVVEGKLTAMPSSLDPSASAFTAVAVTDSDLIKPEKDLAQGSVTEDSKIDSII